jgi:heme oxygenase
MIISSRQARQKYKETLKTVAFFSQDIEVKLSAGEVPDMDEAMAELERKYSEVEEELVNPGRCGKRLFWRHFLLKH